MNALYKLDTEQNLRCGKVALEVIIEKKKRRQFSIIPGTPYWPQLISNIITSDEVKVQTLKTSSGLTLRPKNERISGKTEFEDCSECFFSCLKSQRKNQTDKRTTN